MNTRSLLAFSSVAFTSKGTTTVLLAPDKEILKVPVTSIELSSALSAKLSCHYAPKTDRACITQKGNQRAKVSDPSSWVIGKNERRLDIRSLARVQTVRHVVSWREEATVAFTLQQHFGVLFEAPYRMGSVQSRTAQYDTTIAQVSLPEGSLHSLKDPCNRPHPYPSFFEHENPCVGRFTKELAALL